MKAVADAGLGEEVEELDAAVVDFSGYTHAEKAAEGDCYMEWAGAFGSVTGMVDTGGNCLEDHNEPSAAAEVRIESAVARLDL